MGPHAGYSPGSCSGTHRYGMPGQYSLLPIQGDLLGCAIGPAITDIEIGIAAEIHARDRGDKRFSRLYARRTENHTSYHRLYLRTILLCPINDQLGDRSAQSKASVYITAIMNSGP